jgi:hypothetical protein
VQIIEGVKEAQEQVGGDAMVNPLSQPDGMVRRVAPDRARSQRIIHNVEFDVAVTASSGSEAKAGAGLMVAAIGLGAQSQKSTENTAISRVRFEVPIALPTSSRFEDSALARLAGGYSS